MLIPTKNRIGPSRSVDNQFDHFRNGGVAIRSNSFPPDCIVPCRFFVMDLAVSLTWGVGKNQIYSLVQPVAYKRHCDVEMCYFFFEKKNNNMKVKGKESSIQHFTVK